MSLQRNHYEVLGVPQSASTDEIKKKYRELARKFHPDVVQDKILGQKVFSQINQAYHVLADPDRRASYNNSLAGGERNGQIATAPTANGVRPSGSPFPASGSRSPAPGAATASRPNGLTANTAPGPTLDPQQSASIARFLSDAQTAVMEGKFANVLLICEKILEVDPRNAKALDMLGDALKQMGKPEQAAAAYRRSLQIAPSALVQAKLDQLTRAAAPPRTAPPQPDIGKDDKPGGLGRFFGRK